MPKPYPAEFRRRALDLLESGRTVRDLASVLGIAESCLYGWKSKSLDLIARGQKTPTPAAVESAALAAAERRIADLESRHESSSGSNRVSQRWQRRRSGKSA